MCGGGEDGRREGNEVGGFGDACKCCESRTKEVVVDGGWKTQGHLRAGERDPD